MKICTKCKIEKPKLEFSLCATYKDGLYSWCKPCSSVYKKKYDSTPQRKEANKKFRGSPKGKEIERRYKQSSKCKETNRKSNLKRRYGITIEEYNKILESQGGVCAVCGTDTPNGVGKFHVDHDHITGKVRGIICSNCNRMLGYSKDSIKTHQRAIKYLMEVSV